MDQRLADNEFPSSLARLGPLALGLIPKAKVWPHCVLHSGVIILV